MLDKYTLEYTYEEQVEDLSQALGVSKTEAKRFLSSQRSLIREKLRLGYACNLRGLNKIEPQRRANGIVLTSRVAQSVPRPITIKEESMYEGDESFNKQLVSDEEFI